MLEQYLRNAAIICHSPRARACVVQNCVKKWTSYLTMCRYWQEEAEKYCTPITRLIILELITGERPAQGSDRIVRYFTEFLTDWLTDWQTDSQFGLQETDVIWTARQEFISFFCIFSKNPHSYVKVWWGCRTDSDWKNLRTRSHVLELDQFTFSPRILEFHSACFQTLIKNTVLRRCYFICYKNLFLSCLF
jgi:hypothetical protein